MIETIYCLAGKYYLLIMLKPLELEFKVETIANCNSLSGSKILLDFSLNFTYFVI